MLQHCLFSLCQMLAISVEKQRKRPPFWKLCLADGWAGGGRPGPDQPVFSFFRIMSGLPDYYRIVYFYYFKCFRLVLKSKANASLFSNFAWRTDGRGAGGRKGQTCQTEIYYRIVYVYCFKCFRLVLKSQGNARLFSNFIWQRKWSQFLKLCLADDNG